MPEKIETPKPFNPLDKKNLAESIANALFETPSSQLPPAAPFIGAGIYAIYYKGAYSPYQPIVKAHYPIYVGKAVPAGSRKGGFGLEAEPGQVLYRRLREHAESIEEAANLKSTDFQCQFLVTEDIWIPLGENLLIEKFKPIWNMVIDGFGNHDPGKGRYNQQRSPWDVIHPGRSWAQRCQPYSKSSQEILENLRAHFTSLKI